MPELGSYGSVRRARGNSRPCREKHLLQATFSHVAVLVTVFDFGGDPAADFVRMRMEPPFG
jgi:hypothetical protein